MIISRNEQFEEKILEDMYASLYDGDRHQPSVSGMIYCLTKLYYEQHMVVDPNAPPPRNRQQLNYFVTGLAFEKVLLGSMQRSEMGEYDGIQWHADHIGSNGAFIELKSTRARIPKELSDVLSDGWRKQILSYFKANNLTKGNLVVFHIIPADIRAYDLEFTQEEVDDNWNWIKWRASVYSLAVENASPPEPFKHNMDWECKSCNWLVLCNARKNGMNMGQNI